MCATSFIPYILLGPDLSTTQSSTHQNSDTELKEIIHDAIRFISYFQDPIHQSGFHVYISALCFSPKSCALYRHYHTQDDPYVTVLSGGNLHWSACQRVLECGSEIQSSALSHDGSLIACCCDKGILIWDTKTGKQHGELLYHPYASAITFSPDDKCLISLSSQREISLGQVHNPKQHILGKHPGFRSGSRKLPAKSNLWNVFNGAHIGGFTFADPTRITCVAFSPTGMQIAVGMSDGIQLWSIDSHSTFTKGHILRNKRAFIECIAYCPDASRLVCGSDEQTLQLWDPITGDLLLGPLFGHRNGVKCVIWLPDGNQMVSGSLDGQIIVWDSSNGHIVRIVSADDGIRSLAWSSNHVISGSWSGRIQLWDIENGHRYGNPFICTTAVPFVASSPQGETIVSASGSEIRFWDTRAIANTDLRNSDYHDTHPIQHIKFSPSSRLVISQSKNRIRLLNASTGSQLGNSINIEGEFSRTVLSPDEKYLVTITKTSAHLWDLRGEESDCKVLVPLSTDSWPSAHFSHDSQYLLVWSTTAYARTCVQLWSVTSGNLVKEKSVKGRPAAAFDPEGKRIMIAMAVGENEVLQFLDSSNLETLPEPINSDIGYTVKSISFSPNGYCAALLSLPVSTGGFYEDFILLNTSTGKIFGDTMIGVLFSVDGERIISRLRNTQLLSWNASTGESRPYSQEELERESHLFTEWIRERHPHLHMSKDGWVTEYNGRRLFWLPSSLRPDQDSEHCLPYDMHTGKVVIGGSLGVVTIVDVRSLLRFMNPNISFFDS